MRQRIRCTTSSDDAVFYHTDKSRAAAVLDLHFPYWDIPITVDDYTVYSEDQKFMN